MTGPWTEDQASHLYALVYDGLHLCGCGYQIAALDLVKTLLSLTPFYDHRPEVTAALGPNLGAGFIVLSVLDDAGLIEHGTVIDGSWITAKGRAVRHLLSLGDAETLSSVSTGYPHDGEPCPDPGCWAAWDPGEDET